MTETMPLFLRLLSDEDLMVRRATTNTLNYVARRNAALVKDALPPVLDLLYSESVFKVCLRPSHPSPYLAFACEAAVGVEVCSPVVL